MFNHNQTELRPSEVHARCHAHSLNIGGKTNLWTKSPILNQKHVVQVILTVTALNVKICQAARCIRKLELILNIPARTDQHFLGISILLVHSDVTGPDRFWEICPI